MAWLESHQSLFGHRKTLQAASILKIDRYKLIGHLHVLWWWAIDNVDAYGSLDGITDDVVDSAAGWTGKRSFTAALRESGFIDSDGLHNWEDYVGKYVHKKELDKLKKRKDRAEKSGGRPRDIPATALLEGVEGEQGQENNHRKR